MFRNPGNVSVIPGIPICAYEYFRNFTPGGVSIVNGIYSSVEYTTMLDIYE